VKKGSDLVLQVHYHPSGKDDTDQSTVGLYFSKKPVKKVVTGIAVAQPILNIPAGEPRVEVGAESEPIPADVHVRGLTPHKHNQGRDRKENRAAALDQGLGLQLAGRLSVCAALAAAEGIEDSPASGVRQFGRQPQEPEQPAEGRDLG
jgi:hypothetical protein